MKSLARILLLTHTLAAITLAAPGILNHQGRIAVGGTNFDGTGHFKFALVDAAGTASFWSNDGSSTGGGEPGVAIAVPVVNGHYALALGETNPIPPGVFAGNDDVRLRVWFSTTGTGGSFELLAPDRRLASAAFALSAASVADGAINKLDSPDGSIVGVVRTGNAGGVVIGDAALEATPFLRRRGAATSGECNDVAVQGDFAYLSCGGLQIIEISDPDNPVTRGLHAAPGSLAVAVQGNLAFLVVQVGMQFELHLFDVSDPDAIVAKGVVGIGGGQQAAFGDLVVVGSRAYTSVVGYTGDAPPPEGESWAQSLLQITDASDPDNPVILGDILGEFASALAVQDDLLYLGTVTGFTTPQPRIAVFDVTTPSAPTLLGQESLGLGVSSVEALTISGDHLFVGTDLEGLRAYDATDPADLVLLDTELGLGLVDFAVADGIAFVTTSTGVLTYEVSDPSDLRFRESLGGFNSLAAIAARSNLAYVADSDRQAPSLQIVSRQVVRATVGGALSLSGELFDSAASRGTGGQVLSSSGTGTSWIDLLDNDPTNELQSWETLPGIPAGFADGSDAVDDADADPSNELQSWATLPGIPAGFADGIDAVNDADADRTNELQTLRFSNGSILLSDGGGAVRIGELTAAIPDNAISGAMLAPNSVDGSHLIDLSVGTADLGAKSVTEAKLDTGAVTSAKIRDNEISAADLAANSVGASEISDGAVGSTELASNAVNSSKILDDSVTSADIANGGITSLDLGSGSVTSGAIADGSVANADLANLSVTSAKIAINTITATHIATSAIGAGEIAANAVGASEIASNAVGSAEVIDESLTASDLAANSVGASEIAANAVGNSELVGDVDFSTVTVTGTYRFSTSGSDETLGWDSSQLRLEVSDDLAATGAIHAGWTGNLSEAVPYNRFAANSSTFTLTGLNSASDVLIADDLEVFGDTRTYGNLHVGTSIGTDDDSIYFDFATSERLYWDNSPGQFVFTDDLEALSFKTTSDRDAKRAFAEVDPAEVLEKIVRLPVTSWQFREDAEDVRHIGPTAQDFHAAFGLGGADDRHIATVDADGVALAAIQALKAENDALRARLQKLESLVETLTPQTETPIK